MKTPSKLDKVKKQLADEVARGLLTQEEAAERLEDVILSQLGYGWDADDDWTVGYDGEEEYDAESSDDDL